MLFFRCLQKLTKVESAGLATMWELLDRREKLQNAEKNCEDIQSNLEQCRQYLTDLKIPVGKAQQMLVKEDTEVESAILTSLFAKAGVSSQHESLKKLKVQLRDQKSPVPENEDSPFMIALHKNLDEILRVLARLRDLTAEIRRELNEQKELIARTKRLVITDAEECTAMT